MNGRIITERPVSEMALLRGKIRPVIAKHG